MINTALSLLAVLAAWLGLAIVVAILWALAARYVFAIQVHEPTTEGSLPDEPQSS